MTKSKMREIVNAIISIRESATDEQALNSIALYPEWKADVSYTVGQRVLYNSILYKVLQAHTSQADWTPVNAPSLFARVLIVDENVIPEWVQPDSTNPYMKGDKVTHNGVTYESLIDNNVWEPGVIGTESLWTVVE